MKLADEPEFHPACNPKEEELNSSFDNDNHYHIVINESGFKRYENSIEVLFFYKNSIDSKYFLGGFN